MPWQPGQSGNPSGGQKRVKPFRDALNMELAALENDLPVPEVKAGSLRAIARGLLTRAVDDTVSAKEVADRIDGKVPQAVVGDTEHPPVQIERIERVIIDPANPNGESVPPVA